VRVNVLVIGDDVRFDLLVLDQLLPDLHGVLCEGESGAWQMDSSEGTGEGTVTVKA
jgi:hypothetical protein